MSGILDEVFKEFPSKTLFKNIDDNFAREYANMIMDYVTIDMVRIRQQLAERIKNDFHKLCYNERHSSHRMLDEEDIIKILLGEQIKGDGTNE